MNTTQPLDLQTFTQAMRRVGGFGLAPRLAVALSGGVDSCALTFLTAAWVRRRGGTLIALHVNHGLRDNTNDQEVVQTLCARLDVELVIIGAPQEQLRRPTGTYETSARAWRYERLFEEAAQRGCLHLLTAHHLNDHTETFWMNLARGSGLEGLSSISATRYWPLVRVVRPLLDIPKARLAATCQHHHITFAVDPTNDTDRSPRHQWRQLTPTLTALGANNHRIANVTQHAKEAQEVIDRLVDTFFIKAAHWDGWSISLLRAELSKTPLAVARQAVRRIVTGMTQSTRPLNVALLRGIVPRERHIVTLMTILTNPHDHPPLHHVFYWGSLVKGKTAMTFYPSAHPQSLENLTPDASLRLISSEEDNEDDVDHDVIIASRSCIM